ncbi:hypothetical protein [Polynucleobacter antarcticus]|uniref:Uncharacterized protein n=1 Tax=Polynucleobacter antarcticus TaxID=1743162 RepID=A0A6M9PPK3_9BURK|nr:hypothetical protein [Polynucleobacter antarcticus]QKM61832.1 hypothetical protein DCO16_01290 [Polynucleobacter antarcticus]
MPQWIKKSAISSKLLRDLRQAEQTNQAKAANGFILLEALVAMTLVATSWVALGNTYQTVVLRLGQAQAQQIKIHQELDQHEITILASRQLQAITPTPSLSKSALNESTGMSRRSRPITHSGSATNKK